MPAVVLATPPWVTTGLAATELAAGRYVLAEKPIATGTPATAPLRALPAEQRARLQVGMTYRHDPAMALLRSWLAGGELGSPLLVRAHVYDERRDPADPAHTARITETLAHGSPVMHEGAHVLDWLGYLLGAAPEMADAWSVRTRTGLPAPNLIGARFGYPDGTVALVEFGWLTDALPRCELTFSGDRGHVVLDGFSFDLTRETAAGTEHVVLPGERTERSFDAQLDRFADLVTGAAPVAAPGLADALAVLADCERMQELATAQPDDESAPHVETSDLEGSIR